MKIIIDTIEPYIVLERGQIVKNLSDSYLVWLDRREFALIDNDVINIKKIDSKGRWGGGNFL